MIIFCVSPTFCQQIGFIMTTSAFKTPVMGNILTSVMGKFLHLIQCCLFCTKSILKEETFMKIKNNRESFQFILFILYRHFSYNASISLKQSLLNISDNWSTITSY